MLVLFTCKQKLICGFFLEKLIKVSPRFSLIRGSVIESDICFSKMRNSQSKSFSKKLVIINFNNSFGESPFVMDFY